MRYERAVTYAPDVEAEMLLHCPRCHARQTVSDIPSGSSLCPTCGADVVLIEESSPLDQLPSDSYLNQLPVTTSQPHGSRHDSSFEVAGEVTVPERLGRYRIVGFLGGGGFANVYLADDAELDRQVALKVPRAERFQSDADVERFLQEARVLARLTHPSIVQVYDVGESDGIRYIVTQYIDGEPLTQRLRRDDLSGRDIARLMIPCAQALHSSHLKGVFHRDFKPGNVLLDRDGKPFVADFGLAIARHRQRIHAGEVAGTISYMSPEQVSGDAHLLDGRSDIWSVGVVIYQMLTGELPFRGTIDEVADEIVKRSVQPPRQVNAKVSRELERICLKCLQKQPDARYLSAQDLAEDLENWLKSPDSVGDAGTSPVSETPEKSAASPSYWLTLAAGICCVVVVLAIASQPSQNAPGLPDPSIAESVPQHELPETPAKAMTSNIAPEADPEHVDSPPTDSVPQLLRSNDAFRLNEWGVVNKWISLLDQSPRPGILDPTRMTTRILHDRELSEVTMNTPDYALASVGRTESTTFTFEIGFSRTNWDGWAGLFWGLKNVRWNEQDDVQQCHTLYLTTFQRGRNTVHRLTREVWRFVKEDRQLVKYSEAIAGMEVVMPQRPEKRLEVTVGPDGLRSVNWCGLGKPDLLHEPAEKNLNKVGNDGEFGLLSASGTTLFHDARIKLLAGE